MQLEIYGKQSCTYCTQAVELCKTHGISYKYIDVGEPDKLDNLIQRMGTRPRTVPQIFKDGALLPGGYTGLMQELVKN